MTVPDVESLYHQQCRAMHSGTRASSQDFPMHIPQSSACCYHLPCDVTRDLFASYFFKKVVTIA